MGARLDLDLKVVIVGIVVGIRRVGKEIDCDGGVLGMGDCLFVCRDDDWDVIS